MNLSLPVGCLTSNVNTAARLPVQGSKATGFGTSCTTKYIFLSTYNIYYCIIIIINITYDFAFSQIAWNRNGRYWWYLITMNGIPFFYFNLNHWKRSAGHLFHFHKHSLHAKLTEQYNIIIIAMHLYKRSTTKHRNIKTCSNFFRFKRITSKIRFFWQWPKVKNKICRCLLFTHKWQDLPVSCDTCHISVWVSTVWRPPTAIAKNICNVITKIWGNTMIIIPTESAAVKLYVRRECDEKLLKI